MQVRLPFSHFDFNDPPRGVTRALLAAAAVSAAVVIGLFYSLWRLL